MEDFRGCEKETKTKAYSKEGLQKQTVQKDTKGPLRAWLQESVDDITEQLKKYETQLSDFALSDDPDVLEKTITLEHRIERHQFHLEHLEYLLTAWENDTVTKQQIKSIRDAVNEYIAENENEDYYENEEIYEEAGISTEGSILIVDDDQLNAVSEPALDAEAANEKEEETTEKVPPKEGNVSLSLSPVMRSHEHLDLFLWSRFGPQSLNLLRPRKRKNLLPRRKQSKLFDQPKSQRKWNLRRILER